MAHLIPMSLDDFRGLPEKLVPRTVRMSDPSLASQEAADWIFAGYCEKLSEQTAPLGELRDKHSSDLDGDAFLSQTTRGQRILLHLSALDGEVENGGIAQFIWNCPNMVLPTLAALESLGYEELLRVYEKVIDDLGSHAEEWVRLRNADQTDSDEMWDSFDTASQLINGDDFDDPYFDYLGAKARRMAIEYVNANTHEFITGNSSRANA